MKDKLLYTTKELFDSYLHGKQYCIPPYQRGYKWETKDIDRLLKDINDFLPNEDLDLFYCLQNITLVEQPDCYNVVDGQQRLTTLTIILSFLGEYDLINKKLRYDVRTETEAFLQEYVYTPSELKNINTWDDFLCISTAEKKDYDFQDIYYLFNAFKTVQRWFSSNTDEAENMKNKILNHVKLIVNLPKSIEEQELFENLNGKRVPLDGADLIRALIITRVAKKEVEEIDDATKHNVLINERRVKIGLMLDTFNLWWSGENKQEYFRHFTREAKISEASSVAFNDITYPINNLYKLYTLIYSGDNKVNMDFFEKKSTEDGFIEELQMLQRTIENWYNDKELYHIILFSILYANDGSAEKHINKLNFKEMFSLWKKHPRKGFIKALKERIANDRDIDDLIKQADLSDNDNESKAFQETWYDEKLVKVSTLLDIISILTTKNKENLPAKYFKACEEDLEHIFPQTPIGKRIKDKVKQTQILEQYINIINQHIPDQEQQVILDKTEIDWDNQDWKDKTQSYINDKISKIIPINSLGNMCVLHESVNRGYGNDFFLEKRIDIMRKSQEGYFIRPHVYDAFNKIYIKRESGGINMSMMTLWDKTDILARRKYIVIEIQKFLNTSYEQA